MFLSFRRFGKLKATAMEKNRNSSTASASESTADENLTAPHETASVDRTGQTKESESATIHERRLVDWSLIWTILAIKGIILVFGATVYLTFVNKPIATWYGYLEIWNQWDSLRHIRLAQIGYTGAGSDRADLIGFPLYPWLVWLFSFIFRDYLLSSFIVSGLALLAAGLLLQKLVLTELENSTIAFNAVWFMLIFPTAHFLHINYNESLFLALTVGCFLAARKGFWRLAGILGVFVCLTRLNGLIIFPVLLVEAFWQYRATRRPQWNWLWILIAPLGFGIYLLLNWHVAGDALAFLTVSKENFQKSFDFPWNGIKGVYNLMWSAEISRSQIGGVQEFVFIVLGAVGTVVCAFLLRPSYAVWMLLNWLIFVCGGFIISVPRYTLVMFPLYIIFAYLAERRFWHSVITTWSLLFLGFFIIKFVQGHWTF